MGDFDLVSDLHLDMRDNPEALLRAITPSSEALVIAGDLAEARNLQQDWLRILVDKYEEVLYVPGNHEYYGGSWEDTLDLLWKKAAEVRRVYVLQNTTIHTTARHANEPNNIIGFAGTTLWFPNDPRNGLYSKSMGDFFHIRDFDPEVYQQHEQSKAFLRQSWADVWVVHHLPFARSIHPQYMDSKLNRFFLGDITDVLSDRAERDPDILPKVIVHGHTHMPCDYEIGDIRVVCNPFGYPGEGNEHIIPKEISL